MRSEEQLVQTVRIGTIFETEYVGINNWDLETYIKIEMDTVKSRVLTRLILKHMQAFSYCL